MKFEECIVKINPPKKIKSTEYLVAGLYPIISQDNNIISGYWNNIDDIVTTDKPVIIFGDHTRVIKYVDYSFSVGADGVIILQPKKELISKYFYYCLKSSYIPNLGYSRHYKLLKELNILVPPLQTQQQIVKELDCLASIIEKQKKQLEELDNLAQSIFNDMFGNPIENEKGWVKNELQNICIINPPKKEINSILFNSDDDVSFLPMEDLDSYALHFKPIKCRALSEVKNNYTYFSEGDIVMAKVTPCFENGKIGIATNLRNEIGFGSSELLVYRSKGDVLQVYLYFVLSSESFHLFGHNNLNGVSGLRRLTKKASHCFMIPIPPLSLQQQFASKIEAIEKQKELIKKSIKETEDLFNSRMDYYFN